MAETEYPHSLNPMATREAQGHQLVLVKSTFKDKDMLAYFVPNYDVLNRL
jgi:hypothetical protein